MTGQYFDQVLLVLGGADGVILLVRGTELITPLWASWSRHTVRNIHQTGRIPLISLGCKMSK